MTTYVIAHFRVEDRDGYQDYVRRAVPTITAHGGRIVAADDGVVDLWHGREGTRVVLIGFDSAAGALAWQGSEDYRAIRALREDASETFSVLLVHGVDEAADR